MHYFQPTNHLIAQRITIIMPQIFFYYHPKLLLYQNYYYLFHGNLNSSVGFFFFTINYLWIQEDLLYPLYSKFIQSFHPPNLNVTHRMNFIFHSLMIMAVIYNKLGIDNFNQTSMEKSFSPEKMMQYFSQMTVV